MTHAKRALSIWLSLCCVAALGTYVRAVQAFTLIELSYTRVNLVSDINGVARFTDPNLVNPWGLAAGPTSPFWVANNGSGTSTIYNNEGVAPATGTMMVTIPPAPGSAPGTTGVPTGVVFNSTTDFTIPPSGTASRFIFATEDGTLAGWGPGLNSTTAITVADKSATGAVYKGLALASNGSNNFLYATNFRAGTVDVFDAHFLPAVQTGTFTDPALPAGYAPFGIQAINGQIFVTYALQDANKHDDVAGVGHGYIDIYDPSGNFVKHFASQGQLNSPWGLALAPGNFGTLSGALLVGNFGDGFINGFDSTQGTNLGTLPGEFGNPIRIDALWGLTFGNGSDAGGATNSLFFAAGIPDESHGLFGRIRPTAVPFTVTKLQISLDFTNTGNDMIALIGAVPLPPTFTFKNQKVFVDVGGVTQAFSLDAKGVDFETNAAIKVNTSKNGLNLFQVKLIKGSFQTQMAALGMTNAPAKGVPVQVTVSVHINQTLFEVTDGLLYTEKQGKPGVAK